MVDRHRLFVVGQCIGGAAPEAAQTLIDTGHHRGQRLVPHVDAIVCEKIEGVQPHLCIAFALVQSLEN